MVKIALITEGVTDQFILKPIIENYFDNQEFHFNPISPPVDETDKQTGFGGWVNVVNSCKNEDFKEMFKRNEFVVIHIDADISYQKGFDVDDILDGKKKESNVLCNDIIDKLKSFIPAEIFDQYSEKFLFAIGFLTMECWLMTLVSTTTSDTINCTHKLNSIIKKKNMNPINEKNKNSYSSRQTYKVLASKFKNKKTILEHSKKNVGFDNFVNQLSLMKF